MLMTLEKSQNFTYYAGIMLDAFAVLSVLLAMLKTMLKPSL